MCDVALLVAYILKRVAAMASGHDVLLLWDNIFGLCVPSLLLVS